MSKPEPIATTSQAPLDDRIQQLRALIPEAFSEGRIDFDKLRAALGDFVDDSPERYNFTWAGKRDALRLLQTPTRATLTPCPEESVDWEATRNIFIEGDNLEALKLMLKPYYGRVKMIYIDPPYNTGNDFIYPDNYADPLDTYLQLTGQKDAAGNLQTSNPESSGRYHSAWLSMMYPRLFLARQLLRGDGVIFISIDDNEVHNLRAMMNEIFGEENFVANIVWQKKYAVSSDAKGIPPMHDHVIVYQKSSAFIPNLLPRTEKQNQAYTNPDNDPRGLWKSGDLTRSEFRERDWYAITSPQTGNQTYPPEGSSWRHPKNVIEELICDNRIWFGVDGASMPSVKRFLSEVRQGRVASAWWPHQEVGHTHESKKEMQGLFDGQSPFDTPKPVRLMKRMLELCTENGGNDLVVDFFAGSCTLSQGVIEHNRSDGGTRQFIVIQIPENVPEKSNAHRMGFANIADVGKERIRRVIARLKAPTPGPSPKGRGGAGQLGMDLLTRATPEDLGFKVYKLAESNLLSWSGVEQDDGEAYAQQMELFNDPLVEGWQAEDVICEVALKEAGFSLNYRAESVEGISGQTVYRVEDPESEQHFYICLDERLALENLTSLELTPEDLFICRAIALDDATAANLALQCRLKTI